MRKRCQRMRSNNLIKRHIRNCDWAIVSCYNFSLLSKTLSELVFLNFICTVSIFKSILRHSSKKWIFSIPVTIQTEGTESILICRNGVIYGYFMRILNTQHIVTVHSYFHADIFTVLVRNVFV